MTGELQQLCKDKSLSKEDVNIFCTVTQLFLS